MITDLPIDVVVPAWGTYVEQLEPTLVSARQARTCIVVTDDPVSAQRAGADRTIEIDPVIGIAGAREVGLDHVEAPFVLFIDSGDELLPGALERLLSPLLARRDLIASTGGFRRVSDGRAWPIPILGRLATTPIGVPLLLAQNVLPTVGACVLRVSRLPRPLFPALEDEDWHAAIRVRAQGHVSFNPHPALTYQDQAGSVSRRPRLASALRISHALLLASAESARGRPSSLWRVTDRAVAGYRNQRTETLLAAWGRAHEP